jgi:hypothetical protein
VLHYNNPEEPVAPFLDETLSTNSSENDDCFSLCTRLFISGDLAFFSKDPWKRKYGSMLVHLVHASTKGMVELWSIEKIHNIRNQVEAKQLAEEPCNIRGCTERPLFYAVPVENFIIRLLHIIIDMGNALVDGLIEFIEAKVEKLEKVEVEARNHTIFKG